MCYLFDSQSDRIPFLNAVFRVFGHIATQDEVYTTRLERKRSGRGGGGGGEGEERGRGKAGRRRRRRKEGESGDDQHRQCKHSLFAKL